MASILKHETLSIATEFDLVAVRHQVREHAVAVGLSIVQVTKFVTAASEISRNMIDYAKGGNVSIEQLQNGVTKGIRVIFKDEGPGIADLDQALQDGFSTKKSLGLGLPGTKRLVAEFDITSTLGNGTEVRITEWHI